MIYKNNKLTVSLLFGLWLVLSSEILLALGVPANTTISNTATISYDVSGEIVNINSTSSFVVVELIDISVVWQDAANVSAISAENNVALTFEITNTGNGIEQYLLSVDGVLPGNDFNIAAAGLEIWIDDGDASWSAATDTLYNGSNGPVLNGAVASNDSIIVFVLATIPAAVSVGDLSSIELTAVSSTASAAGEVGNIGAEMIAAGDGGVDAIVGFSGATANEIGTIEIISAGVSISKTVTVIDTIGGNDPHTGATLRYTLDVQIAGSNSIDNLIIVDPIPNITSYTASSITLNSASQTDAQDSPLDFSDFNISNTNSVTVDLSQGGAVTIVPPANFIIEFDVTID